MNRDSIKKAVRDRYGEISKNMNSCCPPQASCCGDSAPPLSRNLGYSDEELKGIPQGADLGLGCGNPLALASINKGETVLDLGSGAGIDCFLAAARVGPEGKVIGVDMTPEMIEKGRQNAAKGNFSNIEFRLGEIENLPVADNSVDLVISNCVINLSPDKERVFKESFRVLKPGGRLMVSDIVLEKELPQRVKNSIDAYIGCIAGALQKEDYLEAVKKAGFIDVNILGEQPFPWESCVNDPLFNTLINEAGLQKDDLAGTAGSVISLSLSAQKPDTV